MAPHSSTLAWKIPWTEEPGRLQSMGLQRVGHDWATSLHYFIQKSISEFKCVRVLLDFIIARILTKSYVRKKKNNILSLWVLIRIMTYTRPHKPAHNSTLKCQNWEPATRIPQSMPFKIWDTWDLVGQGYSSKCQNWVAHINMAVLSHTSGG